MKFAIAVLFCFAGFCYYVQAECNSDTSVNVPYDCGKLGESHFFQNEKGECAYTCLVNGSHKSCQQAHPIKLIERYIRSRCRTSVFDCEGKGEEHLSEDDDYCSYGCRVGDMILVCEQTHPLL
ncbi:hypothetical protein RN001_014357 [Aquatica leii]|uniref:Secreted protein n=1 Tax=Aquatica leii TaxID=1421715 RepID=A0AAN7QBJ6_9COLE|nr:hypothetical protein RN001_014357 [Aquatica leii]